MYQLHVAFLQHYHHCRPLLCANKSIQLNRGSHQEIYDSFGAFCDLFFCFGTKVDIIEEQFFIQPESNPIHLHYANELSSRYCDYVICILSIPHKRYEQECQDTDLETIL